MSAVALEMNNMQSDTVDTGHSSRRRHERTATEGRVHGEVAAAQDETLIGNTFEGTVIEVSPCGMRIETDLDISAGTLDMFVYLAGFERRMFLSCGIRWSESVGDGMHQAGVEIIANPLCDLDAWCEYQREQWFLHKAQTA